MVDREPTKRADELAMRSVEWRREVAEARASRRLGSACRLTERPFRYPRKLYMCIHTTYANAPCARGRSNAFGARVFVFASATVVAN